MAAILNFKYTTGAGDGDYSHPHPLGSFDTHARWQPVTQSARSRRSYGKIEDCEQSNDSDAFWSFFYILFGSLCAQVSSGIARQWSREKFAILTLRHRSPGGHLGIFWVGMCRPGLQIDTPF